MFGRRLMACGLLCAMGMTAVAFAVEPVQLYEPPTRLGAYLVLDRVAEGGMALIFRGRDPDTGDLVALKMPRTGHPHEIAGLEREIAALSRLRHAGIVGLVAQDRYDGLPWMALELLEGETLFQEIVTIWTDISEREPPHRPGSRHPDLDRDQQDRHDRYDGPTARPGWVEAMEADHALACPVWLPAAGRLRHALSLMISLAPAVTHIHNQGFVHRDLTPGNVFLGRDGRTTLIDFGLACRVEDSHAETGAARLCQGTVEYAAPEQLCGEPVDARADIFSLGSILYELVTGRLPFNGDSAEEIARNHLEREPVCPSELVRGLPWQLEDLILDMLAKDPACRPGHAGEVAARLKDVIRRCCDS